MAGKLKSKVFANIKLPKKLDQYVHKNKKVVIQGTLGILFLIVLLVLEYIFGIFSISFLGPKMIKKSMDEIRTLQKQVEKDQAAYRYVLSRETQVIQQCHEYWVTSRDGNINEKFQDKITTDAKNSKVDLSTTGTVKLSEIGNDIMSGELEISCSGKMEGITRFLYALTYSTPKMYWNRFSLRPDNYNNPSTIYLSGEVKFLLVDNSDIVSLFTKVKK